MRPFRALALFSFALPFLIACGTTPAPDFRGRWRPANAYSEQPEPISLRPVIQYAISPADMTLKGVLERWAADAGTKLRYEASVDYTLHAEASSVSSADLGDALAQLQGAYARQAIRIALRDGLISVEVADEADASTSERQRSGPCGV